MFFITQKLPAETRNRLYCTWVRQNERPEAPLVAVWTDPAMSASESSAAADRTDGFEVVVLRVQEREKTA